MKIIYFFSLILLITQTLQGMETHKKLLSREEFLQQLQQIERPSKFSGTGKLKPYKKHECRAIASLAFHTDMPNHDKLQYIWGDDQWSICKKIIIILIKEENFHPDQIKHLHRTPLEKSIIYDDVPFARYLLKKGAAVTSDMLKIKRTTQISPTRFSLILHVNISQEMSELLQTHAH